MPKNLPAADALRKLLRYDADTGKLFWRDRTTSDFKVADQCSSWNARYSGKEAFTAYDRDGYRRGSICDRQYLSHRVVWAMHYGSDPGIGIDHINRVKDDNRIENLRIATDSENRKNMPMQKNNTSGHTGVVWHKYAKMWYSKIKIGGKVVSLGYYHSIQDAVSARAEAILKYGFSEGHGLPLRHTTSQAGE